MKISEFEYEMGKPVKLDAALENTVKVKDDDKGVEVVYCGNLYNLFIEGKRLRGNGSISKSENNEGSLIPMWRFDNEKSIFDIICLDGLNYREYRVAIKTRANDKNLVLTEKLLDTVFGPIDKKALELYSKVLKN